MEPYLNSLAHQLLAETQAEVSGQQQAHQPAWDKNLRHQLGGLLVTLGQKIQASEALFEDIGCPCLEDEMHPSR